MDQVLVFADLCIISLEAYLHEELNDNKKVAW